MSSIQYVGEVLSGFADAFEPLEDGLASGQTLSGFLAEFGWSLDPNSDVTIGQAFAGLPPLLASLRSAPPRSSPDSGDQAEAIAEAIAQLIVAIKDLATAINALSQTTPATVWPSPLNSAAFWEQFSLELLDFLIYRYLENHHPRVFAPLRLIGFLSEDYSVPLTAGRVPYISARRAMGSTDRGGDTPGRSSQRSLRVGRAA